MNRKIAVALCVAVAIAACNRGDNSSKEATSSALTPTPTNAPQIGSPAVTPPVPKVRLMDRLTGTITGANGDEFLHEVAAHLDNVVGIKVGLHGHKGQDMSKPSLYADDDGGDQLVIYVRPGVLPGKDYPEPSETELVIPKGSYRWEHGGFIVDGFFLVKSGGIHQGTASFGLEPADEAAIRSNPGIRVADRAF